MGGPIVRSGASPEFSKNWENIFGKKKKAASSTGATKATKKINKRKAKRS
jgi:hypothetical protein